ncbi:T9SS type A sorting domain-containing protein [Psychroserpens algicola]|uniref:T9SS type A sorting domain-containing protein n=1 Tax=Psychroserpens algicola TaxID=1719034 RepID=A0ABT0H5Z3_9FLAO|nr:T9SS type A sorting domain-containing protein [Psychroserpens algicola]MCK8479439.1 T9SS type A sorting domain-containing protein [Psychroserpens algicola]
MKKKYVYYVLIVIISFGFSIQKANAQFRIVEVDPSTERVKIKNFGSTTENISAYRLCARFSYDALSNMTLISGNLVSFAPNAEVELTVSFSNGSVLTDASSDLGLYLPTGSFGVAANMIDFTQWGAGGIGRESQAVSNGFWTAGTFINVAPPYEFTGGNTDFGVNFWDTLLSVDDIGDTNKFSISPNPASSHLNVNIPSNVENATLKVFDLLGKKIIEKELSNIQAVSIDVSKWNTGVYVIRVSSDDITQTKRFIKQ